MIKIMKRVLCQYKEMDPDKEESAEVRVQIQIDIIRRSEGGGVYRKI